MRWLPLLLLFLVNISFSQSKKSTGKLFIIGGGDRPDAMVERIISEAGLLQGGYAVILPMSSEDPDSAVYYAKQQFLKRGFTKVYGLNFKKGETLNQQRVDSIRKAKLVYISGGDQVRFMNVVAGTDIEKAIHDVYDGGGMVGGTSAGAAVMSRVMITGNELKHPDYASTFENIEAENIETKQGLGLLQKVIVDQHFVKRIITESYC
jgi:cyanophycinase